MKNRLLTQTEFLESKGPMRFEVNPLDVNLAKIQHELLKRVRPELIGKLSCKSISESYESKDPTKEISTITVECIRYTDRSLPFEIWLTVSDKEKKRKREIRLTRGNGDQIEAYLDSSSFVPACKGHVLYLDYEFYNYRSFGDYVAQIVALVLERAEHEVPEYGDFAPVLETFRNPSSHTDDIVGSFGLQVLKMRSDVVPDPAMRYLQACAYDPSASYKATLMVGSGTKAEIMETMRSEEFVKKLGYTFGELIDTLRD